LGFQNPEGSIVLLLRNELAHEQMVELRLPDRAVWIKLPADSVGTVVSRSA
jgi:O-glycosyl hydrolase